MLRRKLSSRQAALPPPPLPPHWGILLLAPACHNAAINFTSQVQIGGKQAPSKAILIRWSRGACFIPCVACDEAPHPAAGISTSIVPSLSLPLPLSLSLPLSRALSLPLPPASSRTRFYFVLFFCMPAGGCAFAFGCRHRLLRSTQISLF